MKKRDNRGFTLAELLIVVAIIAVLVAFSMPTFSSQLEKSRQSVDISNLRAAYSAARIAQIDGSVNGNQIGGEGSESNLEFFYDIDTGDLLTSTSELTAYGKATQENLIDISQLPDTVKEYYKGNTIDQVIQVTFNPDKTLEKIEFVPLPYTNSSNSSSSNID